MNNHKDNQDRVRIKHIAIAKCNLFFFIVISEKPYFTIYAIKNFVQNTKKHVNSIYIVGIMFVR